MRTSFVVGTFALAFAVTGTSACGSNSNKAESKSAPTQTLGLAQKVAPKPDLGSGGMHDTGGTTGTTGSADTSKSAKYTFVLGEGKTGFEFNSKTLSDEAKAKLDEMIASTKEDLTAAHFAIEGHTDDRGSKAANERVGLARAEAVRQYLFERYEIPLDCISVISCGSDQPLADNATEEGRAMNRRVVVKVLD